MNTQNWIRVIVSLLALLTGWTAPAQWTSVGDGIDYQAFSAAGPNNLFVTRMTRSNTNTTIDTSIAYDMMAGARGDRAEPGGAAGRRDHLVGRELGGEEQGGGGHQRRLLQYDHGRH